MILMDIRMFGMDGIEVIKVVKVRYLFVKVIILIMFEDGYYIFVGLKSGVDGYILKDVDLDEIVVFF